MVNIFQKIKIKKYGMILKKVKGEMLYLTIEPETTPRCESIRLRGKTMTLISSIM